MSTLIFIIFTFFLKISRYSIWSPENLRETGFDMIIQQISSPLICRMPDLSMGREMQLAGRNVGQQFITHNQLQHVWKQLFQHSSPLPALCNSFASFFIFLPCSSVFNFIVLTFKWKLQTVITPKPQMQYKSCGRRPAGQIWSGQKYKNINRKWCLHQSSCC